MDIQQTEFIVNGISYIKKAKPILHHYQDFTENDYMKLWKEIKKTTKYSNMLSH